MDRHSRNSRNKIAVVSTVVGLLVLALTACNTNSDAISVLQAENTSLHATLAAYQNIGPTVTAQATANAQKLATAQSDLGTARAQNRELITQLNGGNPNAAVNSQQTSGANGPLDTTSGSNTAAGNTTGTTGGNTNQNTQAGATPNDPTTFAIAQVTTAYSKDANGCALNPSTQFSTTDSAIWMIADVRNYKRGTEFTAKWAGPDFNHENTWTINSSGAQICVHFYIEPDTLGMAAGTYTVTLSTADGQSQSAQFTVQGQAQNTSQATATP